MKCTQAKGPGYPQRGAAASFGSCGLTLLVIKIKKVQPNFKKKLIKYSPPGKLQVPTAQSGTTPPHAPLTMKNPVHSVTA